MGLVKHGITETTPSNIPFGAGTYYKNLKFEGGAWSGTCIGATNGGGKVSIEGELTDLEVDGALVNWIGQTVKTGGKASMEINMAELTGDNIKMTTHFEEAESEAEGYIKYVDKANIEKGDYLENFAFVGETADKSKKIIVIFDYALCTSAFEYEGKNKEQSTLKATLVAYSELNDDLDTLPVRIYYPGEIAA